MRFLALVIFGITLTGCSATSDMGQALQMAEGQLRIDPVGNEPSHDYLVTIPVMIDFGFNTRKRADRERYVTSLFDEQCAKSVIVDEKQTIIGKFPNGNDRIQYSIMVKCIN